RTSLTNVLWLRRSGGKQIDNLLDGFVGVVICGFQFSSCIARVQHVAQAVAEQVATKHGETDEGARPDRHPRRVGDKAACGIQRRPPAWRWRLLAQSKKR